MRAGRRLDLGFLPVVRIAAPPAAGPDLDEAYLVNAIITIHRTSHGTYGGPRVAAQLSAAGWVVNHKRVERLVRGYDIVGVHQRRTVRITIPAEDHPRSPI